MPWHALGVVAPAPGAAAAQPSHQFRQIVAGHQFSCGVTSAGAALCWGRNDDGQLGDGTRRERHTPGPVSGLGRGVRSISAGIFHACAVLDDGSVKCWGHNHYGALGDGTQRTRLRPVQVLSLFSGVAEVRAGHYSTCALTVGGAVRCWGFSETGNLGDGTTHYRLTPVPVIGLNRGVASIDVAYQHTCAVLLDGSARCWGNNFHGQLGDGTAFNQRYTPVSVVGVGGPIAAIATGDLFYTCARTTAGAVKCWGANEFGQLGLGTIDGATHPVPIPVPGLGRGVNAISSGVAHGCAGMTTGAMKCWGTGMSGQLGTGEELEFSTPVPVSGMGSGVSSISAGSGFTCAVQARVGKCWGRNTNGQIGDGTTVQRNRPVRVR